MGLFVLLIPIFLQFFYTNAVPVVIDVIEFQDDWNYKIKPHNMPLLNISTRNHILPPVLKINDESRESKKIDRTPKSILGDSVRARVSCPICKLGVGLLKKEVEAKTPFAEIRVKFINLCVAFKVESEAVCTGIFDVYGHDVLATLEVIKLGPMEICSLVLGEICGDVAIPLHEWEIPLSDKPKSEITEPELPKEGLPTFKVLHISDTHYDPEYVAGTPANCQEPLCCRLQSSPPIDGKVVPAGKWGSYEKCDSPQFLIDNMLRHIAELHPDIDYIIWTGDLPPHDIWNQSRSSNLMIIQDTVEQMFEIFPTIPIFPALGNHESIPAGNFAPPWMQKPDHSIIWLYNRVADHWRRWLPASTISNTVLHGGFYSVLVRPGFRIISLNTNYCHTLSWWLLANSTDPAQELKWLVYELQQAEDNGEKVHIIGHIPPGSSDCMKVWSRNFYKIVERYENTIMGQFYGHSHADEFEVFYDFQDNRRATGVAYLGPSVTTFDNFNPAYRIYYVDGDHNKTTREVIDHETWTTNLAEANQNGTPQWYRLYSARSAFKMNSLRPTEWAKLIEKLVDSPDLFDLFYKYYYRDSPTRPECDTKCKLQILCDLKSGRSHYRHHLCHDLELIFA